MRPCARRRSFCSLPPLRPQATASRSCASASRPGYASNVEPVPRTRWCAPRARREATRASTPVRRSRCRTEPLEGLARFLDIRTVGLQDKHSAEIGDGFLAPAERLEDVAAGVECAPMVGTHPQGALGVGQPFRRLAGLEVGPRAVVVVAGVWGAEVDRDRNIA